MKRKLLYIVNPISGVNDKGALKKIIEKETRNAGFAYGIYPSVQGGDYAHLYPIIKTEKYTDVIIAGGDGTINQAIHSLRDQHVQFGIIPCGSGNGLAFSAGIPKDPVKALRIAFKGKSRFTDGFFINNQFACMLVGLGFDAQVAHDFANAPKRGLATYVQKTVQNFFTSPAYPFTIVTGGKELHTEAFFISVANSNQFGNHFTIAPKASLRDGLLDVVIMTRQHKLGVIFQTLKQVCGFNKVKSLDLVKENSSLIYFQTERLNITNEGGAPLHIDGDPVETIQEMSFSVIRDCFLLLYP
ncbi:MAG TPA: diacylglycerol kinase family protein [Flavisolibacter sp.]